MKKAILLLALTVICACNKTTDNKYFFDGKPSDEVLNNYLDRAITMMGLLTDEYPDKDADIDFIVETGGILNASLRTAAPAGKTT